MSEPAGTSHAHQKVIMRSILYSALLLSSSAFASTDDTLRVGDLDPSVMPHQLDFDPGTLQLEVNGMRVKGSLKKKLDYLEVVLAADRGVDPAELGFDRRRRELRRRGIGHGLLMGASGVGLVATALAAPWAVAIAAPLSVQAGGVGALMGTRKRFDASGLQRDVDLYGVTDLNAAR